MEAGKKGLVNGGSDDNVFRAEIERLQKMIGKQAIQIEILKKRKSYLGKGGEVLNERDIDVDTKHRGD